MRVLLITIHIKGKLTKTYCKVALIGKLKKAVIYSRQLEELCTQLKCNTSTQLEAKAYYQFMLGMLYFEQTNWQKALLAFTSSQKIYDKLSGMFYLNVDICVK